MAGYRSESTRICRIKVEVRRARAKAEDPQAAGDAMGGMINVIPVIYQDRGTSPLKVDVKSAQTQAPQLELTSAEAAGEKK